MTGATPDGLRRRVWRVIRIAAGWTLVAVGIIGLVLPVLQGVVFITAGLALLATELPWAQRLLHRIRDRLRRRRAGPSVSRRPEGRSAEGRDADDRSATG